MSHSIGDPDAALRETVRVLRPGGVLVVREVDLTSLVGRLAEAGEHPYDFESTFFEPRTLARRVADAGLDARFRTVRVRGSGRTRSSTLVGRAPGET